jgi:hypothetical protein
MNCGSATVGVFGFLLIPSRGERRNRQGADNENQQRNLR